MGRYRHNYRGFTLTELAIVLGVMGSILGGIWTAASMVSANNKVNKAQQELLTIVSNVRTLYSTRGSFASGGLANNATVAQATASASALTQGLINANVFPSDMVNTSVSPPTVTSPWNTPVSVNVGTIGGQTPSASLFWVDFAFNTNNLPSGVCAQFLSQIASLTDIGLITVFDGAEYVTPSASVDATTFAHCAGGASFQFSLNN